MNNSNSWHKLFLLLSLLIFSSGVMFGYASDAEKSEPKTYAAEIEKKYPPYPDVWGYVFPWPGEDDNLSLVNVWKTDDGDYRISYVKKRFKFKRKDGSCCESIHEFSGLLFFSGEAKNSSDSDINALGRRYGTIREKEVIFTDGSRIKHMNEDGRPRFPDPFYRYVIKEDKDGKIISKTHFIWLLEKPLKRPVDRDPVDDRNWSLKSDAFIKHIENVYPIFIPLQDGTFLFHDLDLNFIIRMDQDFESKSELMNVRLFVLDRKVVNEMQKDLQKKNNYNDQTMNDAIVDHIKNLRMEEWK